MERQLTPETDDSHWPHTAVNDADSGIVQPQAALEPDTLPNHPLRAQDVPGFIPKLID